MFESLEDEDMKHKVNVLKKCMVFLMESYTFERPPFSNLLSKGSISSIQENLECIRIEYRKAPKKQDATEVAKPTTL